MAVPEIFALIRCSDVRSLLLISGVVFATSCSGNGEPRNSQNVEFTGEESQTGDSGGDVSPPENIAGAFLVTPEMQSCVVDSFQIDGHLVSICGLAFKAKTDQSISRINLPSRRIPPEPLRTDTATVRVYGSDERDASLQAQKAYKLEKVDFKIGGNAYQSDTTLLLSINREQMLVYSSMPLSKSGSSAIEQIQASLGYGKMLFQKSFPEGGSYPRPNSLDSFLTGLLIQAGMSFVLPRNSSVEAEKDEKASSLRLLKDAKEFSAKRISETDIKEWLASSQIDLSLIFN